jgi:hypothetical protein
VYKLLKDLYGVKQAPRTWYARLKTFLLEHEYVMGSVDKTIFTLNHGCVHAFGLPHDLHFGWQFSEFSGISNTLLSLRFGFLFLCLILLAFPMLILWVVRLTERALLTLVIFLYLLSFTGILENNLLLHSPPPRPSM